MIWLIFGVATNLTYVRGNRGFASYLGQIFLVSLYDFHQLYKSMPIQIPVSLGDTLFVFTDETVRICDFRVYGPLPDVLQVLYCK